MRLILTLLITLGISACIFAQASLNGIWEGTITRGGLHSNDSYKFQLHLEVEGKYIRGKSYVFVSPDSIVYQDLSGRMYEDRSIYLKEVNSEVESRPASAETTAGKKAEVGKWKGEDGSLHDSEQIGENEDGFTRKYQFIYDRSIWESSLEGYWQEVIPKSSLEYHREYGKIMLKKKKDSKA